MQSECGKRLRLVDMGNGLVFIQSETEMGMEETLRGLDEWVKFYLAEWKPWSSVVVSQTR